MQIPLKCAKNGYYLYLDPALKACGSWGIKISARQAVIKQGVPISAGTKEGVHSVGCRQVAKEIGFPVIIKGYGRWWWTRNEDCSLSGDLTQCLPMARSEAQAGFAIPRCT